MSKYTKAINFPEEVKYQFQFLIENYDFKCAITTPLKVRYESRVVFIEVYYGSYDCEVAIEFGRLHKDEKYSFTLFLQWVNPNLNKQMGDRIAYDLGQVRECLIKLADALKSEGQSIISGEAPIFERMKSIRWWDFQPDAVRKQ